jgi:competence protein ComEC
MDDIQRKLAQIDRKLAGGRNLHKHIVSTSPLVFIGIGLMAGIVIQDTFAWSIHLWLMLLVVCVICTFITLGVPKAADRPYITAYMALVCFLCLGAIRLTGFYQPTTNDIRNIVTGERKLATIRGLIVTEPYTNNYGFTVEPNKPKDANEIDKSKDYKGYTEETNQPEDANEIDESKGYKYEYKQWKFARFMHTDPPSSFYLKVKEVQTVTGWADVSGTIRVQVDETVLDLKAGDYVQMYCWLDRFRQPTNPGQFNTAEYLTRKGVFVAASLQSRDGIELLSNSSTGTLGSFIKMKRTLQEIAGQALRGEMDIESENYALLQALIFGYRTEIDRDTYRAFQKTGLLHFICLSGMNFMILIGIIWWLGKTAGLMKPAQAVICLAAAGTFFLVVPPNSPAIRAAIMSSIFCVSFFFCRRYNPFNSLSLAAVILLLVRPTYLFEPGWQLSFACVLGILLFSEPIESCVNERISNWFGENDSRKPTLTLRTIYRFDSLVIKSFSASFAAWLGCAGILLYHFYRIQYLTSIWTVVVSPLIAAISIIGYSKTVLALFLPSAAALLDIIIGPSASLLIWLVKFMASLNISEILIGKISPAVVIFYYVFILFVFFAYLRRPLLKKTICTVMALAVIVFLGVTKWQRTYRDDLILNCLDVGQGQAILMQLPGRANILFDAGSLYINNIGQRIVVPFLDYSGINKIDAIIISHDDVDHINGIPEIVEHCKVNGVYADEAFITAAETNLSNTAGTLKSSLNSQGLQIQRLDKNMEFDSKAKINILWPSEEIHRDEKVSDNDKSVVLLIEFAGRKLLLCSDIEKFAQKELLLLFPNLKADLVVVPHHGSAASTAENFLKSLNADTLICSCGQSQFERIKSETKTLTIKSENTKSFYTASDGLVTVCIDKNGKIKTTTFIKGNSLQ